MLDRLKQIVGPYAKNGYLPEGLAIGDLVALWRIGVVEKYGVVNLKVITKGLEGQRFHTEKLFLSYVQVMDTTSVLMPEKL